MNSKIYIVIVVGLLLISCQNKQEKNEGSSNTPYLLVLGTAQDAGYPQAGCEKACCQRVYKDPSLGRYVSCIAVIDPISNESWIFDATPDFKEQLKLLSDHLKKPGHLPNGIFLTHAHIGHYTGLMHLGKEAMSAKSMPVYAMPQMSSYLAQNGPWSQLVHLNNIKVQPLKNDSTIVLNERLSIRPMLVPHRDEYSETVGYEIISTTKKAIFIPDVDKWHKWDRDIVELVSEVDIALLDATFFQDGEIKGRAMDEIPHPFVEESMTLLEKLSEKDKAKIYFTHFNHTNPLLIKGSPAQKVVLENGFRVAEQGLIIPF